MLVRFLHPFFSLSEKKRVKKKESKKKESKKKKPVHFHGGNQHHVSFSNQTILHPFNLFQDVDNLLFSFLRRERKQNKKTKKKPFQKKHLHLFLVEILEKQAILRLFQMILKQTAKNSIQKEGKKKRKEEKGITSTFKDIFSPIL